LRPRDGAASLESLGYLAKWLPLSLAVGVVAGLGAIVFYLAIDQVTGLALGKLVGYVPPSPAGEGGYLGFEGIARPWLLPFITVVGGLLSGLLVFTLCPEAEGHGTDAVIAAVHHKQGGIAARVPVVKLVASAITIGTGGSAGREGPAAQISAGFASLLGARLHLRPQDRRMLVAAGVGAGIGAIFRAPLGGAVLAAEILYLHDLEVEVLLPALMASIVGYTIYGAVFGFTPIFGSQPDLALTSPVQLLYYAALGLICGLVGILYSRVFYGIAGVSKRLALPAWIKPALGGALVGLIGVRLPQVLHMGYGWLQLAMSPSLRSVPLWVVLLLPFLKILTTSFSIGSGGSGGIFAPGMFIGGMVGAALWRLGDGGLPHMPADPAPFVIVGMMAMFGGIAHAPLAVMLMVAEMTGNLSLLAPAMIAVALSYSVVGDATIYQSQLPNRSSSPIHHMQFSFPLLSSLLVREAMAGPPPMAAPQEALEEIRARLQGQEYAAVCVVDRGLYLGAVPRDVIANQQAGRSQAHLGEMVDRAIMPVAPDQTLDLALEQLSSQPYGWAPVVSADGSLLGQVAVRDVIRTYQRYLTRDIRQVSKLPPGTRLVEVTVEPSAPVAGRALRDAHLPPGSLVISVNRAGDVIFPRGDTRLQPGDVVMLTITSANEAAVRTLLRGKTHG